MAAGWAEVAAGEDEALGWADVAHSASDAEAGHGWADVVEALSEVESDCEDRPSEPQGAGAQGPPNPVDDEADRRVDVYGHGISNTDERLDLGGDRSRWPLKRLLAPAWGQSRRLREETASCFSGLFKPSSHVPPEGAAASEQGDAIQDLAIVDVDDEGAAGEVVEYGRQDGGAAVEALVAIPLGQQRVARVVDEVDVVIERLAAICAANPLHPKINSAVHLKVLGHYLENKSRVTGLMVEAEALQVSRWRAQRLLHACAAAAVSVSRRDMVRMLMKAHVEIVAAGGVSVCLVESSRYDETPMRGRIHNPERVERLAGAGGDIVEIGATAVCKSTHSLAILQTERRLSAVYQIPGQGFVQLRFVIPTWLQSMADGKAETYVACLSRTQLLLPKELLDSFQRRVRLVCTDGASSVERAERAMEFSSGSSVFCLRTKCEIHKAYRIHSEVFEQISSSVSRLKHIALCLNAADSMRGFRCALRDTLRRQLVYRCNSQPSQREIKENVCALDLFLPAKSPGNRLKRAVILGLANGRWSARGRVEHHCVGPSCCVSAAHCLSKFTGIFVACVANCKPLVWPSARWIGAEESASWLGLLEVLHGLLTSCFLTWAAWNPRAQPRNPIVTGLAALTFDFAGHSALGAALGEQQQDPEPGHGSCGSKDAGVESAVPGTDATDQHRKETAKVRRSACEFLASPGDVTLATLVLGARVLKPLAGLIHNHLSVAGGSWAKQKMAQHVRDPATSTHGDANDLRGDHHGALAYCNQFELECLDEIQALMRDGCLWVTMPPSCMHRAMQDRAFAMLANASCLLWEVITAHKGFPWVMFGLLEDPSLNDDILAACPLSMDEWSRAVVNTYKSAPGQLLNDACQAEILAVAREVRRETAQIEAQHASIRRSLFGSPQTHVMLFNDLSAQRTTQQFRKVLKHVRPQRSSGPRGQPDAPQPEGGQDGAAAAAHERRGPAGGAWRAYVREQTLGSGRKPDFRELARRFKLVSPEERERLRQAGKHATERRRRGSTASFGLRTRDAERASRKRARDAVVQSMASSQKRPRRLDGAAAPSSRGCSDLVSGAVGGGGPAARLSQLQESLRLESQARRKIDEDDEKVVQTWMDAEGKQALARAARDVPSLGHRDAELVPSPQRGGRVDVREFEWIPIGVIERVKRALGVQESPEQQALVTSLSMLWQHWHSTVDFEPHAAFESQPEWRQRGPCYDLGQCVCGPAGKVKQRFISALKFVLSRECPASMPLRQQLKSAEVIILLVGQARPKDGQLGPESWTDVVLPDEPIRDAQWLHVGGQSLIPWKSTFHLLRGPTEADLDRGLPREPTLTSASTYLTRAELASRLDLGLRYCMLMYTLQFSLQPVGRFVPCSVTPSSLRGSLRLVWMPWGKRPRAKPRNVPDPGGWADVAEDFSAGDEDDEARDENEESEAGEIDEADGQRDEEHAAEFGEEDDIFGDGDDAPRVAECVDFDSVGPQNDEGDAAEVADLAADIAQACELAAAELAHPGAAAVDDDAPAPLSPEQEVVAAIPAVNLLGGAAPLAFVDADAQHIITMSFSSGTLTWYKATKDFVAVCKCPAHAGRSQGGCRKHRTSIAGRRPQQGRPLGYLAAWLQQAGEYSGACAHRSECSPSFGERQAARAALLQEVEAGSVEASQLLALERPTREDEADEPLELA